MARNPYPARWPSGMRPDVVRSPLKANETFHAGELVKMTSGEVEVCVADPTDVWGIACDPAEDVVEAGYINVYRADYNTVYAISGSSNPTAANLGVAYGVTVSSNLWTLDLTETTTKVFVVEDIDTTNNLFFVKFHNTAIQPA